MEGGVIISSPSSAMEQGSNHFSMDSSITDKEKKAFWITEEEADGKRSVPDKAIVAAPPAEETCALRVARPEKKSSFWSFIDSDDSPSEKEPSDDEDVQPWTIDHMFEYDSKQARASNPIERQKACALAKAKRNYRYVWGEDRILPPPPPSPPSRQRFPEEYLGNREVILDQMWKLDKDDTAEEAVRRVSRQWNHASEEEIREENMNDENEAWTTEDVFEETIKKRSVSDKAIVAAPPAEETCEFRVAPPERKSSFWSLIDSDDKDSPSEKESSDDEDYKQPTLEQMYEYDCKQARASHPIERQKARSLAKVKRNYVYVWGKNRIPPPPQRQQFPEEYLGNRKEAVRRVSRQLNHDPACPPN